MIILISGASHVGKTALAQKLLEEYRFPYLSVDHLKMGLIRSGQTSLTPMSDDLLLTEYLWPIVREMVKTAIENKQNLIVEGCYIPTNALDHFEEEYKKDIKHYLLIMSENYIENHFEDIKKYSSVIEKRLCDDLDKAELLRDNKRLLLEAEEFGADYVLIDDEYKTPLVK